jgi:hypothetical protein
MASLVLSGDTSGSVTLAAPAVAGSTTQTLVNVTGTLAPVVSGTAVSASGTSVDFTGIPSWVKRITVMFSGVSLNSTADILVQLGDSGGIESTGYLGGGAYAANGNAVVGANYTTGFGLKVGAAAGIIYGHMVITNISGNIWVASSSGGFSNAAASFSNGGNKTLSDVLTQIRITSTSTDTFDAGTINILYE